MLSLSAVSARSKVQEVVAILVEGRYHDLVSCVSEPLQQRIRSFTEPNDGRQGFQQDRLSDLLLLSDDGGISGKLDQQENQEKHFQEWLKEMRSNNNNNNNNSRSPDHHPHHNTLLDNCYETSPVFQRSLDSEVEVEVGKMSTATSTAMSRTLVLILVGQSVQSSDQSVGVVLLSIEDDRRNEEKAGAAWKFHGVVCVPRSEECLFSQGWRRIQEQEDAKQSAIGVVNVPPVISTTHKIQEHQQYQKATAAKYCDEDEDDSDDDYWGQYGDPDSENDDSAARSGDNNNSGSSSSEAESSPSSSSADTVFSPSSMHHYTTATNAGAVKYSAAVPASTAVNTIFTTSNSNTFAKNFTSGPNNCRWGYVDKVDDDDDDDDEYWGKYGDHSDLEPEQQNRRGHGKDSEPTTTIIKDSSSHANDIIEMMAERQKTKPSVPTAHHHLQKEALQQTFSEALPDTAFPVLVASVPTLPEPGQVDPTALALRLMNLIVHHTDPTGYATGAGGALRSHQFFTHSNNNSDDEDDDIDIDDPQADNEASTDNSNNNNNNDDDGSSSSSNMRRKGGFLIRLDSRLQQYHDSVVTTPLDESEHQQPHIREEGERGEGFDIPASRSTLFSAPALALASHSNFHALNTSNNSKDDNVGEAGSCTSLSSSPQSRFPSQSLSTTISTYSFPLPPEHNPLHSTVQHQHQHQQGEDHDQSLSPSSCTDSAFQEYLFDQQQQRPSDNKSININNIDNNISNNINNNNVCINQTKRHIILKEKKEREHFLRSLRSMAQEAKNCLGLSKAELLDILDQAYDSPDTNTNTNTTATATH